MLAGYLSTTSGAPSWGALASCFLGWACPCLTGAPGSVEGRGRSFLGGGQSLMSGCVSLGPFLASPAQDEDQRVRQALRSASGALQVFLLRMQRGRSSL